MANIYHRTKATVCNGNQCITVYGDAAKIIQNIAVTTAAIIAIALISKALE